MSTTRTSPPSSTKRLLHELQSYTSDPNPALLHLGPVGESQILHWDAIMKGVEGSAYEGADPILIYGGLDLRVATIERAVQGDRWRLFYPVQRSVGHAFGGNLIANRGSSSGNRRLVETRYQNPGELPHGTTDGQVPDPHLPSQRSFQGNPFVLLPSTVSHGIPSSLPRTH